MACDLAYRPRRTSSHLESRSWSIFGSITEATIRLIPVDVCSCTEIIVQIPAHTCAKPVDAHEDNYTLDYKLAPGVYYVFPGRGTDPTQYKQGLKITVREP